MTFFYKLGPCLIIWFLTSQKKIGFLTSQKKKRKKERKKRKSVENKQSFFYQTNLISYLLNDHLYGKICPFGLLSVCFVDVYQFVCVCVLLFLLVFRARLYKTYDVVS